MAVPAHTYFVVSAIFHYLGPAFAVLLFRHVEVLGVAWLRIASAALVFALWRRPWRHLRTLPADTLWTLLALGTVLAAMNSCFYLAIDRLPLGTVGAIEFLGTVALAAAGARTVRNLAALALVVGGVGVLSDARWAAEPWGLVLAFANCGLFVLYVVLGHRLAQKDDGHRVDRLGAAMLVAFVMVSPLGLSGAARALSDPQLVAAGVGVGVCSSVVPYVCDQLAMARLPRATFALWLALLPAMAVAIGALVLHQLPAALEIVGVVLVIAGVLLHRPAQEK
jgi:inner membrane transporter RhtA